MFATAKLSGKVFIYQLQDAVEYTLCSRLNFFDKQRNMQYNTIQFISSWSNSYSLVTHICSFWWLVLFCSVKKLEHGGQINHSVS